MPFISELPAALENPEDLLSRQKKAAEVKELWRGTLADCYRYAMPARETFSWVSEGQQRERVLYDSTLQECTFEAANTMTATLFPGWTRWAELGAGAAINEDELTDDIVGGLQKATKTFYDYLNASNFSLAIDECALDILVGTCALQFDEGPSDDEPFDFTAIPLSAIEFEEGPNGTVETTFVRRKPQARHLLRMYRGMQEFDLPETLRDLIATKPDSEVEVIQAVVYHPENKHYYGVVLWAAGPNIIWRYDYGQSSPMIVARARKTAGERYGRGRVMRALPDARTLDKIVEFTLRHAAIQIAPPMTGVSDGVLNPYTATIAPNTIIPVASNDSGNPSLQPLDVGGNFSIGETRIDKLQERIRRTMLGPEPMQGPVRSATEHRIFDRNRMWAMNGEYGRIQFELLTKIVARGVFILQRRGLMPKFKLDGREVAVTFNSPFAKSQNLDDVLALQDAISVTALLGPQAVQLTFKPEKVGGWVARKYGVQQDLVRSEDEQIEVVQNVAEAAEKMGAMQEQMGGGEGGMPMMGSGQAGMMGGTGGAGQ